MAFHSADEAQKKFDALPPEVKALLYSPEMLAIITGIGQKHKLHMDQIDVLNAETGQVMLGFVETSNFVSELKDALSTPPETTEAIARDINDQLFLKIRHLMKGTGAPAPSPMPPSAPVAKIPPQAAAKPLPKAPLPPPAPFVAPKPIPPAPRIITPHPADIVLTQKTVTTAPAPTTPAQITNNKPQITNPSPAVPKPYTADPYREIPE